MKRACLLVACVSVLAFQLGCDSDAPTDPTKPTGSIVGHVSAWEVDGSAASSLAGARIELEEAGRSAITDSNGQWRIDGVPAGYYGLHITRPGFADVYQVPFGFVGSGTLYLDDQLGVQRQFRVANYTITLSNPKDTLPGYPSHTFTATVAAADSNGKPVGLQYVRMFAGLKPTIDPYDSSTYLRAGGAAVYVPHVLHSGDSVYLVAYVTPYSPVAYPGAGRAPVLIQLGKPSNVVVTVVR